jgi:endoglucanase
VEELKMEASALEYLQKLLDAPSPSGYEGPAVAVTREYVQSFADSVKVDVHGNLIAAINPEGSPRIMLAGHTDEIGLMVTYVNDKGFIGFRPIGGWDTKQIIGQRVAIHTAKGPVRGVIGATPIHLAEKEDLDKVPKMKDLWIDIGVKDKKAAEKKVEIGDPITVGEGFELWPGDIAISRCFDDKMGTWVCMEALRRLVKKGNVKAAVFAVATVQEEIGLRGARTSCFGIDPELGIACDVTFASDAPGMEPRKFADIQLGKGVVIERGANINHRIYEGLVKTAKDKKIPYQISGAPGATGTDANAIQLTRAGVAAALISVPLRYMHTTVEMLNLKDMDNTAKLMAEYCASLKPGMDFTPF